MTGEPFGEVWLPVDDIVALGRARRKVQVNLSSGKWPSREVGRGRNGKLVREAALSGLPEDLRQRWLQQQIVTPDPTEAVIVDTPVPATTSQSSELRLIEALKRFSTAEREAFLDEARRLMNITQRYIALPIKRQRKPNLEAAGSSPAVRAAVIGATVAETADAPDTGGKAATLSSGYEYTQAVRDLCEEAKCTNEVILDYYRRRQHSLRKGAVPRVARAIAPRTLDEWARLVKTDGLLTFIPRASQTESQIPGSSLQKKDKRKVKISPAALEWMNQNWRSCPHARDLYQKLKKYARKHSLVIPSERWVYRQWKSLPKIVTTALKSKKAYVDKFAPYVPRDFSDLDALQILCGDHSIRDVLVRLPDGSLARPWCSTWQDMRTGLIYGWHLDLTPSSRTIGLAYANGVKTFGAQPIARPELDFYSYLYTDQGKDYKGHTIGGKLISYGRAAAINGGLGALCQQRRVGLIDDLGLKQILARGYNAREKPIERTHRDLSYWERSMFEAEYCGSDPKTKPDACNEAQARHQKLRKRAERSGSTILLNDSPFMTLDDYRDALTGYFLEYNQAAHERSTLGGAKVVPIEEYRRLYTTRYDISESTLALLLMKAEQRMVRKNGVTLFQQGFAYLHPDLAYYKGQYVEVRYMDDDYSRVWIVPPPTDAIPNPEILEAQLVARGGVLHPNKQTLAMIAQQRRHEEKVIREHNFLTQSIIRGESSEDRVAAQLEIEPVEEIVEVAAAGGGPAYPAATAPGSAPARVHLFGRLDRKRSESPFRAVQPVSVDTVRDTAVDESIFAAEEGRGGVVMWEDDDE